MAVIVAGAAAVVGCGVLLTPVASVPARDVDPLWTGGARRLRLSRSAEADAGKYSDRRAAMHPGGGAAAGGGGARGGASMVITAIQK